MRWEKLGRIFMAQGQHPWMRTHAQVPIAEHLGEDLYRIYFTARDVSNRSHVGWLEIDLNRPNEILRLSDTPLLAPGDIGAFDDCGAMSSWLLKRGDKRYFYYVGWTIRATVPFQNAIGLAIGSKDDDPPVALRSFFGPVLDRNRSDPFFCSNPCVLIDGGVWRMWYLSGVGWETQDNKPAALYNIRYAESSDGIDWTRHSHPCLDFEQPEEVAIARPCVLRDTDKYRMWYCYRGRSYPYRIGYAESFDGIRWQRLDIQAGISTSNSGWDSRMICYPYVFDHRGCRYMLYCGNDFSREGFGLAIAR